MANKLLIVMGDSAGISRQVSVDWVRQHTANLLNKKDRSIPQPRQSCATIA